MDRKPEVAWTDTKCTATFVDGVAQPVHGVCEAAMSVVPRTFLSFRWPKNRGHHVLHNV
jgi:hypothetical protein